MAYRLVVTRTAVKDIDKLSTPVKKRVGKKIKFFMLQPDPLLFANHLTDSTAGDYRWRVGDYRVSFDVSGKDIFVLRVRHRREIYRS